MIYLDSSCLLGLLLEERSTPAVRSALKGETMVLISELAELEIEVQLAAAAAGGTIRRAQQRQYQAKLAALRNIDPFYFRRLSGGVFSTALRQHRNPRSVCCRSLDRLHLAAMEELKVTRLMTLDERQAEAADGLGFGVVLPRQE